MNAKKCVEMVGNQTILTNPVGVTMHFRNAPPGASCISEMQSADPDAAALLAGDHVEDVAAYAVGPALARTLVERCVFAGTSNPGGPPSIG